MKDKIFDIVTDLIREDISKDEAIDKLLSLFNVSNRRELLIAFLDDIHSRSYEHIKSDEGKVDAFLSNL